MMTVGSLFSGIGGLELGLEWAGLGPVLWQVESEPKCRAVLAAHWPEVVRHEDVRGVGRANLVPVDLICGGFPCQDVSSAGKRAGLAGARSGLWFEFRRVVDELRPAWVVVENVASGASRWVDAVRESLEQLGYASLPVPIAASDCGAPHERARVFIVAADTSRELRIWEQGRSGGTHGRIQTILGIDGAPRAVADADGRGQHGEPEHAEVASASSDVVDAMRVGRSRAEGSGEQRRPESSSRGWWASEPAVGRVVDGLSGGLAGRARRAQIRALGNAVVPAQAEVIGHVIRELAGG